MEDKTYDRTFSDLRFRSSDFIKMSKIKTYEEINRKLKSGEAVVLTAEEV